MIPYGKHSISPEDIDAVVDTLANSYLTQGNKVPAFEKAISQYVNANYAVATNSATSALHLACLGLGLTKDDIGWTVPLTFAASANAIRYCGAIVDFVDIELATGCICVQALEEKLLHADKTHCLPKVLIVVHYSGISCDMQKIAAICKPYDIKIIEDASHAIGGKYQGSPIGNCQYSDCAIFSFHPVKIITSGEGGMVVTNQAQLASKIKLLASHGIKKETANATEPWLHQQHQLGFNYRMSDLHAALGLSQLNKLEDFVAQRRAIAERYHQALNELPLNYLHVPDNCESSWHIYVIRLNEHSALDRLTLYKSLHLREIGCQVHYMPVYKHPYYQALGFEEHQCVNSERFYQRCLTLPLYPYMKEQDYVIEQMHSLLSGT